MSLLWQERKINVHKPLYKVAVTPRGRANEFNNNSGFQVLNIHLEFRNLHLIVWFSFSPNNLSFNIT